MQLYAVLLSLSLGAAAQEAPQAPVTPAQSAALAQANAADAGKNVFDGSVKRRDGALEIVSEDKNVLVERNHVGPGRDCDIDDVGAGDRGHMIRRCTPTPAKTVTTYGDVQKVRIADRGAYNRKGALTGGLIGGGIGLLGFLALLCAPLGLGIGIGIACVAIGAAIGAGVGYEVADHKPESFERVVNKRDEVSYP